MIRFVRSARMGALGVVALFVVAALPAAAAASAARDFSVTVSPHAAKPGSLVVVTLTLPAGTAAADGRVLFDSRAADFVGVAPLSGGTALYPEVVPGGVAFGAYDLRSQGRGTILRFILEPLVPGSLQVRVLVDATASAGGRRLAIRQGSRVAGIAVAGSAAFHAAPTASARPAPAQSAVPVQDQVANGRIDQQDLAVVRSAWTGAALSGRVCGNGSNGDATGDANGDGCVDIVDVQATLAALGTRTRVPMAAAAAATAPAGVAGAPDGTRTWVVNSTADTNDADRSDGICADIHGACTLRAAMAQADWLPGNDVITFDLPGPAPATIKLTSGLPAITDLAGSMTIDGYSQPGSRVNTATVGSNAVPGVVLQGNGVIGDDPARQVAIYMTSAGNTVRGLVINNVYRGILIDGPNAHDNTIAGNWLGFTASGLTPATIGDKGILINTGATHNFIGTPDLADRNVIGNWTKAIDSYGPGTNYNTIQDNLFCLGPTGFTRAPCGTGVDHDFGPKYELLGGFAVNARNVFGPTTLQGVEYSHGWNRNDSTDHTTTWQIIGNRAIGNWVGFRGDGSYQANYRSGQLFAPTDNGEGINVYDGSSQNVIQGNYIAAVYAGIQVMSPNADGNTLQGNVIGVSPTGQAAPMSSWGIRIRFATTMDVVKGNRISNAAAGGIGLVNVDNLGNLQPVADNIRISQNIVTNTSGPAIYLAPTQGHPTQGANTLLHAPSITSAKALVVRGHGIPGASVEVYRATRGAGKAGLPDLYYGTATVAGDGTWSLTLATTLAPQWVTALQIAPDQNTSALAINVKVTP